ARNAVKAKLFTFSEHDRVSARKGLQIHKDVTVGIYVGKYGGLYYEEEAFYVYKRCFEAIPEFRLIILSPQPEHEIKQYLEQSNIDSEKVYITSVPHTEVPRYLA